jgi:hypothetical protein
MFSLQDLLGQEQGNAAVDQIGQTAGLDPSTTSSVIQTALPAILGGLANNAATPDGAESLNKALEQHHDGSLLDNLGGLGSMIFGGETQAPPPPQADAGGILGHIFGNSQGQVAQQVSNQTGVSTGQVAQVLMMLAPIVMSYLGRQKQQQGVDAGGLGGLIGGLLGGQSSAAAGGIGGLASSVLDRDGDGSAVDDIASMAMNYWKNR